MFRRPRPQSEQERLELERKKKQAWPAKALYHGPPGAIFRRLFCARAPAKSRPPTARHRHPVWYRSPS
jgi:hypothetical protein